MSDKSTHYHIKVEITIFAHSKEKSYFETISTLPFFYLYTNKNTKIICVA